jgi:cephalosporin hydroxylase
MSGSVEVPDGARSSSSTFLKVLAVLLLALAAGEFFLVVHYHRQKVAAETVAPVKAVAPVDTAKLVEDFQKVYYDSRVWQTTTWLGVPSAQAPTDNWAMQQLICELRPDYIVESGTFKGGTTLFYAMVLSSVNPKGKVITIDVEPLVKDASQWPVWKAHVEYLIGSSVEPKVTDHIAQEVAGKKVLVTLDSLHTHDHVLKEMEIYSKLVPVGSNLVVQDTNVNGHPVLSEYGPGPGEAVQDFLKTHDDFVVDRSREKFLLTFYPGGWLKRVK